MRSFTDAARSTIEQAALEAAALHHDYVGTGHILLGLLRRVNGRAAEILAALHVDRGDATTRTLQQLVPGKPIARMGERPLTPRAVKVLESAMSAADDFRDRDVDLDHLLIGLTSVAEGTAAQTLTSAGVTTDVVIREARRLRT